MATDQKERSEIIDRVASYGFPRYLGWQLAFQLLPGWTVNDIVCVLDQVEGIEDGFDSLRTVHRDRTVTNHRSWLWVKAPWDLMQQAARDHKALCVNQKGEFELLHDGFHAISHAGIEGLFEDDKNRGLPQSVLDELFGLIMPLEVQWLWIDSLAIPSGRRDLNVAEERLKNELINMMTEIYGRATGVIVLDALVMHLLSDKPLDIAVALLCGRWNRRMWTFQEGRLAKNITLLTKSGSIDFRELVFTIEREKHLNETSEIVRALKTMMSNNHRPRLQDIATTFFSRNAGLFLDYARSLFPVLNVKWDDRMSRDQAMAMIYDRFRPEAVNLICSYGPARLVEGPGWAPASLHGIWLQDIPAGKWTSRGIESEWYVYNIRSAGRHEANELSLNLEFDQGAAAEFSGWAFSSHNENEKARQGFIDKVTAGTGALLTHQPLEPMKHTKFLGKYRIVLLVAQLPNEQHKLYQVYLTAQIFWLEKVGQGTLQKLTLSHDSPFYTPSAADSQETLVIRSMTTDVDLPTSRGNLIHQAVRQGDLERLQMLLESRDEETPNIIATDSRGWTPLHWAVALRPQKPVKTIKLLIKHGAFVDPEGNNVKSPLILALELSRDDVVELLLEKGASTKMTAGVTPLAQAVLMRRSRRILELLLTHGARINEAVHGFSPLWLAHQDDMSYLLEKGADASARSPTGETCLHRAASGDDQATIELLVNHGAPVDILERATGSTSLVFAIDKQNLASVQALLRLQANANFRTRNGYPLIAGAAAGLSTEILQALLQAGAKADTAISEELSTPLHIAVKNGRFANLNLLLEQADSQITIWKKDKDGMTARDLALKLESKDMATLLERRMKNEQPPKNQSLDINTLTAMWLLVLGMFGILNYSTCARPRTLEESMASYWVRILLSSDLLALKFFIGIMVIGLVSAAMDRNKWSRMSMQDALNKGWKNAPDSGSNLIAGYVGLATYPLGIWYSDSPLRSYSGVGVLLAATAVVLVMWYCSAANDLSRSSYLYIVVYLWFAPMSMFGGEMFGTYAIMSPAVAALMAYVTVLALADDGKRSKKEQDDFPASRTGMVISVGLWVVVTSASFALGYELLPTTVLIVSGGYFAVTLLRAVTGRKINIDLLGVRMLLFGSFAIAVMFTYVNATATFDMVSVAFLGIVLRDIKIAVGNFAGCKSQKRERKSDELTFELGLIAGAVVRVLFMLERRLGIEVYLTCLVLLTVASVLFWWRRGVKNMRTGGVGVAPYVVVVCAMWVGVGVWRGWMRLNSGETVGVVGVLGGLGAALMWFGVGMKRGALSSKLTWK